MDNVWSPQPRKTEVFRFGLFRFRSPLLSESRLISLPKATEMFQFASCLFVKLWIHLTMRTLLQHAGSPIRKSADQCVCATTRSLSQLITSFVDDRCQGIRPALLVTWPIWSRDLSQDRYGSLFLNRLKSKTHFYMNEKILNMNPRLAYS